MPGKVNSNLPVTGWGPFPATSGPYGRRPKTPQELYEESLAQSTGVSPLAPSAGPQQGSARIKPGQPAYSLEDYGPEAASALAGLDQGHPEDFLTGRNRQGVPQTATFLGQFNLHAQPPNPFNQAFQIPALGEPGNIYTDPTAAGGALAQAAQAGATLIPAPLPPASIPVPPKSGEVQGTLNPLLAPLPVAAPTTLPVNPPSRYNPLSGRWETAPSMGYMNPYTGFWKDSPWEGIPGGGISQAQPGSNMQAGLPSPQYPGTGMFQSPFAAASSYPSYPSSSSSYGSSPYGSPYSPMGSYWNQEQQLYALQLAQHYNELTGMYQTPGPNGAPIGPPIPTVPYRTSYAGQFGYDPLTGEQTLAARSQEEQRALQAAQFAGRLVPTAPVGRNQRLDVGLGPLQEFVRSTVGNPQGEQFWNTYDSYIQNTYPDLYPALSRGEDVGVYMTRHPELRAYLYGSRYRNNLLSQRPPAVSATIPPVNAGLFNQGYPVGPLGQEGTVPPGYTG